MTVKELRELLAEADDNLEVLIPVTGEFDGRFYSPCSEESGVAGMGTEDLTDEDEAELKLLDKEPPSEPSFILIPCGFFEPVDHNHELN